MTTAAKERVETEPAVVNCYDLVDRIWRSCGLEDLTEGMYLGDPGTPYEEAQTNQLDWLLDEIDCREGSVALDIGCGNGTLLARAQQRGAKAIGITVSQPQAYRCSDHCLDVYLLDYRNIWSNWYGTFDGIVANGSIEHFVQPHEAQAGRTNDIYGEMFAICQRLLKKGGRCRLATTVIHANPDRYIPDPEKMMRSPFCFRWGSDDFHMSMLARCMGGYYPQPGQLEMCARPYFELVEEVDGTEDYRLTSEEWLRRIGQTVWHWRKGPPLVWSLLPFFARHSRQGLLFLVYMAAHSWQWQFRGEKPPTRLLRQVWQSKIGE